MSYNVRAGDTMSSIASSHHVSLSKLENANHQVKNPNLILVGEKLNIPGQKDSFHHGNGSGHTPSHGSNAHHHASRPKDPVKRLNQDLSNMKKDKAGEQKAAKGEKKAEGKLTQDKAAEKTALGKIDSQKQALVTQIAAQQNPTDGSAPTGPTAQQAQQLVNLGQQYAKTQDRFESTFAKDKKAILGEKKAAAHDKKAWGNARHQALKDLKPAEYHLGLKQTNKDRKELGLKGLKHALRPQFPNSVGGSVGKWISEAQQVLSAHGVPASKMSARDIAIIIQHESAGNPRAINNWDSNAAAGHPSEGLMQTIGPTFNSYKLAGHGQILNPVDNIIAGVRYAISRYGSISNVPGVVAVHRGGSYVGY